MPYAHSRYGTNVTSRMGEPFAVDVCSEPPRIGDYVKVTSYGYGARAADCGRFGTVVKVGRTRVRVRFADSDVRAISTFCLQLRSRAALSPIAPSPATHNPQKEPDTMTTRQFSPAQSNILRRCMQRFLAALGGNPPEAIRGPLPYFRTEHRSVQLLVRRGIVRHADGGGIVPTDAGVRTYLLSRPR